MCGMFQVTGGDIRCVAERDAGEKGGRTYRMTGGAPAAAAAAAGGGHAGVEVMLQVSGNDCERNEKKEVN